MPQQNTTCLVGIAVTTFPEPFCGRFFLLFGTVIQREFSAAGLRIQSWGGFCRPAFCVYTLRVQDRNEAMRRLRQIAADYNLSDTAEIAYMDEAEDYWRTVYPAGAAEPFDRFLAQEEVDAAKAECDQTRRVMQKLHNLLDRDTPPEG